MEVSESREHMERGQNMLSGEGTGNPYRSGGQASTCWEGSRGWDRRAKGLEAAQSATQQKHGAGVGGN